MVDTFNELHKAIRDNDGWLTIELKERMYNYFGDNILVEQVYWMSKNGYTKGKIKSFIYDVLLKTTDELDIK